MFYGVPFYNTCGLFHLILLFLWWNDYFFNISRICFRDRFWFHNFFSDFISYQFSCYFSCFMGYFFGTDFSASSPVFVAVAINFSHIYRWDFPRMTKSRIFWSIFMFLVLQNIVSLPFINEQCQIKSVVHFKQSNTFPIFCFVY